MSSEQSFLTSFIQKTVPISDDIASQIASYFEPVVFYKNDFVLKEGKVCNDYIFLEKGFMRAYTFDADGNEVTTNFYGEQSVVFEVASYFKRTPSKENIQALTECRSWVGNYEQFQILFHSIPEFREFGRAILVNGFITLKERTLSMINLTAEQRYEQLLKSNPAVFQNSSLKHIALYLGITDTSLSRIRKEIAQK